MGSSMHSERDNKINMALLTKISKNIDGKPKKSSHNHVLAPMHIQNDIITRPLERGRQNPNTDPTNYNIRATQEYLEQLTTRKNERKKSNWKHQGKQREVSPKKIDWQDIDSEDSDNQLREAKMKRQYAEKSSEM